MTYKKEVLYVAFDVEAAGPRLGVHGTLSVGACAVSGERMSYEEYLAKGLVFYAELKPTSLENLDAAMRVGCSELECLREKKLLDARYDHESKFFDPAFVLAHMRDVCEEPESAAKRFCDWLARVRGEKVVIPLTDTVFFDAGRVSLWLDEHCELGSPLGHSGRDLKSIYAGFARRRGVRLREIEVPRNARPHKADHDAVELAQKAGTLLYERLHW